MRPASTKAWTAPRRALPTRSCRRPSTSTPTRWRPIPVHLLYVIEQAIRREQLPEETESRWIEFLKEELSPRYAEFIGNEIQKAYLESYHDFGQNLFDRYVAYADAWIEDHDFKDPDTGQLMSRQVLEQELSKIEKPAGIANPKDFRFEVVKFSLRARSKNGGKNPSWTSYEKIREVIERRMFSQVEDLLPVISFGKKQDSETEKKHEEFVQRMVERGYTPAPGAPSRGMVHAGQEIELTSACVRGALPCASLIATRRELVSRRVFAVQGPRGCSHLSR